MAIPTLILRVTEATPVTHKFQTKELQLGDGYAQVASVGKSDGLRDYSITTGFMPLVDSMSLLNQLKLWKGKQAFRWSPRPGKEPEGLFVCKQWQLTLATAGERQLSATFEGVIK